MSGATAWLVVSLGLGVVAVRRRSVAVALVTLQALVLVAVALAAAGTANDVVAAAALALRALVLATLFLLVVARTRESRPVRAHVSPFRRVAAATAFALALTWLVPSIGLTSRDAERAALALVAFGVATVALRRATIFQVLGIVVVENALALSALELPAGGSAVIELGVALDLVLVSVVALAFHERIFAEFGAGDTSALRTLRD